MYMQVASHSIINFILKCLVLIASQRGLQFVLQRLSCVYLVCQVRSEKCFLPFLSLSSLFPAFSPFLFQYSIPVFIPSLIFFFPIFPAILYLPLLSTSHPLVSSARCSFPSTSCSPSLCSLPSLYSLSSPFALSAFALPLWSAFCTCAPLRLNPHFPYSPRIPDITSTKDSVHYTCPQLHASTYTWLCTKPLCVTSATFLPLDFYCSSSTLSFCSTLRKIIYLAWK